MSIINNRKSVYKKLKECNMNTTSELRKKNTLIILKSIMQGGAITKVDVAAQTGMTLMTVNTIMNNLVEKNILIDRGTAVSSTGRKAILYAVNPSDHYILGINIGIGSVTLAVSNLVIEKKDIQEIKVSTKNKPLETIEIIKNSLFNLMEKHKIKAENVLGLGITVPGPVNEKSGVIHSLPNLKGWEGISLKDIFEKSFDIPVFVEKDNYASVLYLKTSLGIPYQDVVSLTIKGGIGTGILLGGNLHRGVNGIAGEIGHVAVNTDGPRCNCGNFGCLECYASDFSIIDEVKNRIQNGKECGIPYPTGIGADELDIDNVIAAAKDDDELCCSVILKAAKFLGIAVSNAIKFYDPACFIINSKWIKEIDGVSTAITEIVNEKCTLLQSKEINLVFHYEEDVYLMGALSLVVEHTLEETTDNRLIG
jgi:predicted NBD/HSP70 family sugar kinase